MSSSTAIDKLESVPDEEFVEGVVNQAAQPPSHASTTDATELMQDSIDADKALDVFRKRQAQRVAGLSLAEPGVPGETLEERFNRLKLEVTDLGAQLDAAKAAGQAPSSADAVSDKALAAMATEVQELKLQLQQAKLDEALAARAVSVQQTPGTRSDDIKKLMSELGSFKAAATSEGDASGTSDGKGVTYELYYQPAQAKYQQASRAAALEKRIQALEQTIGGQNMSALAGFLDVTDLSLKAAVQALAMRVDSLSDTNVNELGKRLTVVLKQLSDVKSKTKDMKVATEYADKVNELYSLTQRWDETSAAVPDVVARLRQLRNLHEQAAEFGSTLTHLETVQQEVRDQLATQGVTLKTLEEGFKKNMSTISQNIEQITKRMTALESKLK